MKYLSTALAVAWFAAAYAAAPIGAVGDTVATDAADQKATSKWLPVQAEEAEGASTANAGSQLEAVVEQLAPAATTDVPAATVAIALDSPDAMVEESNDQKQEQRLQEVERAEPQLEIRFKNDADVGRSASWMASTAVLAIGMAIVVGVVVTFKRHRVLQQHEQGECVDNVGNWLILSLPCATVEQDQLRQSLLNSDMDYAAM